MKIATRTLKTLRRKLIRLLPARARAAILRRMVRVSLRADARLSFKIAETQEELEQAFRILHDSYVCEGFMKPNASGLRVTPYHALPTTTTLIAKWEDRVIGTVSVIRRTSLGLPLEKAFSLEKLDRDGAQFVEISSLAIAKDFRSECHILLLLCKFLFEYCMKFITVDYMVIAVNPKDEPLYEDLLCFDRLREETVRSYDFANGAPAVGFCMSLREAHNRLLEAYFNAPAHRNLFSFFMVGISPACFQFPVRQYYKTFDPVMTPRMLKYFFSEKTSIFAELEPAQLLKIRKNYEGSPEHAMAFPAVESRQTASPEKLRYRVRLSGVAEVGSPALAVGIQVLNVSASGLQGKLTRRLDPGQEVSLRLRINGSESSDLRAKIVWVRDQGIAGFQVLQADRSWARLLRSLQGDLHRGASLRFELSAPEVSAQTHYRLQ